MTPVARHRIDADVAIVGSGFAGSILALVLRRHGLRVALLDRGRHPRFAIGESSTPLANLLLEQLADRHELPRLRPFAKWGTWQAAYPHVACGIKRGFSFFRHERGATFTDPARERQLLVAASPHDAIADTHWYRPDFDQWLVREAEAAGVEYRDVVVLDTPRLDPAGVVLEGTRDGARLEVHAGFLVDASGPRGYLWRALDLGDAPLQWLPPTQGLYTHFEGVRRWDSLVPSPGTPPYPVDDAAVHHVLDDAWIWVLRFGNGITSAGLAATDGAAQAYRLADGQRAWDRVLADHPSVQAQFREATPVHPFINAPRVAHRVRTIAGARFALLPSAAGVIDPLLSTGFPLTLLGVGRIADILLGTAAGPERDRALEGYAADTTAELDATEQLVAALYATMDDFPLFTRLAALYFAAASFSEAVRRLGHAHRANGFLLHADPVFGPALRECTAMARALPRGARRAEARRRLLDAIGAAIEPFDVAGLNDASRRNWFPVLAGDLVAARDRVGASASEIEALLARCGFDDHASAAAGSPSEEHA